jgi:hypothetical protein
MQVVSLTSRLRGFHNEVVIEPNLTHGLEQSSAAQRQHVGAVSPARVVRKLGNIGPNAGADPRSDRRHHRPAASLRPAHLDDQPLEFGDSSMFVM